MQELKLISEDSNYFVIGWQRSDSANEYIIEGMTELFDYVPIARVKNCSYVCNKNSEFIGYRVVYIANNTSENHDFVLDCTNMVMGGKVEFSPISIVCIKSAYDMVSMTFRDEKQYNLYRLFDENGKLLNETEDCIVLGHFPNGNYYVAGYDKVDNEYKLTGMSDMTWCEPKNCVHSQTPLLSIVIPIYNSKKFLARTVQSILSSTFTNFEIILVNDGSESETKGVCDWYANNFDCINVIHKENGGLSSARNRGMEKVKGEWVSFIDSDDIVHPYMYEKLLQNANLYNTDIAISQCISRENYENICTVFGNYQNKNIIVMDSYKEVISKRGWENSVYFTAVWNKIVKTDIARKVSFEEDLKHYEDTAYTPALYSYVNKFVLVKDAYYIWDKRQRKTVGTLSTKNHKQPAEIIWRDYIKACATVLKTGNPSTEIAEVYKYDVLRVLLRTYSEREYAGVIKNVVGGMIKYYVRKYNLPTDAFLNSEADSKLYTFWQEIENNNLPEYDGGDNIPKEYYQ